MRISAAIAVSLMFGFGASMPAVSGPPLITDDASTLAPGACQFETEQRRFREINEWDVVVACNAVFDTEFGVGKLRVAPDGAPRTESTVFQIKKVFAPADASSWVLGIAGASIHATGGQSGPRQLLASALLSRNFDATNVHLNAGVARDQEADAGGRRNRATWAAAAEHDVSARWNIAAEVFGQQGLPAAAQIGLRWWAIPKYVQLTSSLGAMRGAGRDGRWVSIGLHIESGE